ncbi:MAG: hypothetical protein KDD89_15460, partial [Anaerolineales bacterium]|nr:hypothetical protein [Anaerolineales bacterium]
KEFFLELVCFFAPFAPLREIQKLVVIYLAHSRQEKKNAMNELLSSKSWFSLPLCLILSWR